MLPTEGRVENHYSAFNTSLWCRHLGNAGEAAVHLLSRLLAFDPARRCSAEEALVHEYLLYFETISMQAGRIHFLIMILESRFFPSSSCFFVLGDRGVVHPPSGDQGTK